MSKEISHATVVAHGSPEEYTVDYHANGYQAPHHVPPDAYKWPVEGLMYDGETTLHLVPDTPAVRESVAAVNHLCIVYQRPPNDHVSYVPDPINPPAGNFGVLDTSIQEVLPDVQRDMKQVGGDRAYDVITHMTTRETMSWIEELQQQGMRVDAAYLPKDYSPTSIDMRRGFSSSRLQDSGTSFCSRYGIAAPLGVIIDDHHDIAAAYHHVAGQTQRMGVYIKLDISGGAVAVQKISSAEEATHVYEEWADRGMVHCGPGGSVVPVELQAEIPGIRALCSFQYEGAHIISPGNGDQEKSAFTKQLFQKDHPEAWGGNQFGRGVQLDGFTSQQRLDAHLSTKLLQLRFLRGLEKEARQKNEDFAKKRGGVDFAIVDRDVLRLAGLEELFLGKLFADMTRKDSMVAIALEHNGARSTGGTTAIEAAHRFGLLHTQMPFINIEVTPRCSPGEVVQFMQEKKLLWNRNGKKTGGIPWAGVYDTTRGVYNQSLLIATPEPSQLPQVQAQLLDTLARYGVIHQNGPSVSNDSYLQRVKNLLQKVGR